MDKLRPSFFAFQHKNWLECKKGEPIYIYIRRNMLLQGQPFLCGEKSAWCHFIPFYSLCYFGQGNAFKPLHRRIHAQHSLLFPSYHTPCLIQGNISAHNAPTDDPLPGGTGYDNWPIHRHLADAIGARLIRPWLPIPFARIP